ncbi:beta strand repeat-containing protein [Pedosphaera parvula]|uniref:Autotransporter-associated beta strand repeat protein n=1 Tax=Pedosphaera parvula (strain Ellin514) TaxID=320771 RepID=B9XHK3_PEDPL|nr:autotransporter-associated beta strand repeat-containing protein [Pedosphaera parvula]EEF60581.1 autotransporter-associated beta strand repeat protein [Pedosphaera parvula Ellin514]
MKTTHLSNMNPGLPRKLSDHLVQIRQPILALSLMLLSMGGVSAANLTWDAGNTNNGATINPASGSWNTDTANLGWNNGSGNVSWTQTSTTAGLNGAIFNGPDAAAGTYQISLDLGQIAFTNLAINANGYTFNGPGSMFLNTSGTLLVADGKNVTFNNNFAQNNSAKFWQLGTGPVPATMTVNGNIAGDQIVFNSTNGSTFLLGGNTAGSVVTIDANVWQTNGTSTGVATWQVGRAVPGSGNNNTGVFVLDGPNTVMNFNTSLQISRGGGNGTVILQNGATMNVGTVSAAQNVQIESESGGTPHGTFKMYGGTLNVGAVGSGTAIGQIKLAQQGSPAGATAVFTQTGGVVNAWGGIFIGAASGTFNGGTAAFTNSGGFLYIGSGGSIGVSRGTVFPPTNYFVLSGGTVGALSSWISSVPMMLDTLNGNITFQCADANTTPFNISLSGALTGPGGLNKTGGGTLQLSGANNYAGSTVVSDGTLRIITSLSPTNGPVVLDGSAGSPVNTVQVANVGQFWSIGNLTYAAGTPTADFNYLTFVPSTTVAPIQVNGNLTFTVTPQVTIAGSGIPVGDYPLIQYTGTLSGTPPTTPVSLPPGTVATIVNNTASKRIVLHVTSGANPALSWRVGNGVWDINGTPNWTQLGSPATYNPDDGTKSLLFDDTASGTSPITVTLNSIVHPAGVTANNTTKSYIFAGNGSIDGSATFTKSGTGMVTMATTNTYTGGTTINAGQLNINYGGDGSLNSAIGTGPLTNVLGAKIDNTSGHAVTLLTPIPQYWLDDWTFVGSANFNTGPGAVTLGSSVVTLTVVSNAFEVGGTISDNGLGYKLFKAGNGALTLRTDNSFAGGLELGSGVLNLGSANCAGNGILTIDGGAIDNVSGSDLTLGGVLSVSIPIANGGTFTFLGTSSLDLGPATINANNGQVMFWNIVTNTLTTEGDIVSGNTTITKIGKGTLVIGGFGASSQFTGIINEGQVDLAKGAGVAVGTGGQGLLVQSNSVVRITGDTGNQIANSPTTYVQTRLSSGGVLDLNGRSETLDMLSITNGILRNGASGTLSTLTIVGTTGVHPTNTLTLNDVNCQFDVPPADAELDIAATIDGAGSLVKTGLGTLSLLNSNNYTGNITVSSGTLVLAFPSLSTNSAVNVATNATLGTNAILNLNFANSETNTVSTLVLGGVSKAPGIYNAITDPHYITGSGSLQVIPVSTINPLPGPIQFNVQSSVSGSTLALSWPTNLGWILQSQTNALSTGLVNNSNAWFDMPGSAAVTSTNLTINPTNSTVFFRLRLP